MWSLPLELCESIMDHLNWFYDAPTLRACSLVCKAWLPRTRCNLFNKVSVSPFNLQNFLDVLSASETSPSKYVRTLHINHSDGNGRFEVRWANQDLHVLVTQLSEVTKLHITYMEWQLLDDVTRASFISGFRRLEALWLIDSNFPTFPQLAEFVASFPSLQSLSCESLSGLLDEGTAPASLFCTPHTLHTLHLGPFHTSILVDWILNQNSVPEIHTFEFLYRLSQAQHAGRLIRGLGPRLKHLTIGLSWMDRGASALQEHIDLGHNTCLKSIHLKDVKFVQEYSFDDAMVDCIPLILSQIRSSKIEEVRFSFWIVRMHLHEMDVLDPQWAKINYLLCQRGRFPALRRVVIIITRQVDTEAMEDWIRQCLPELEALGMLYVEFL